MRQKVKILFTIAIRRLVCDMPNAKTATQTNAEKLGKSTTVTTVANTEKMQ